MLGGALEERVLKCDLQLDRAYIRTLTSIKNQVYGVHSAWHASDECATWQKEKCRITTDERFTRSRATGIASCSRWQGSALLLPLLQ